MGRSTTWSEEVDTQALEYLENYETKHEHAFPSVVGLCSVIKRAKSTIYDWGNPDHSSYQPSFSDILASINEKQELVAFNKGMKNEYNASLVKLLLGKHGYSDKQESTLQGPGGGPIETDNNHFLFEGVNEETTDD